MQRTIDYSIPWGKHLNSLSWEPVQVQNSNVQCRQTIAESNSNKNILKQTSTGYFSYNMEINVKTNNKNKNYFTTCADRYTYLYM